MTINPYGRSPYSAPILPPQEEEKSKEPEKVFMPGGFPEELLQKLQNTGAFYEGLFWACREYIIKEEGEVLTGYFSQTLRDFIKENILLKSPFKEECRPAILRYSAQVRRQDPEFPVFAISYRSHQNPQSTRNVLIVYDTKKKKLYKGRYFDLKNYDREKELQFFSEHPEYVFTNSTIYQEEQSIYYHPEEDIFSDDAESFFKNPEKSPQKITFIPVPKDLEFKDAVKQFYESYVSSYNR